MIRRLLVCLCLMALTIAPASAAPAYSPLAVPESERHTPPANFIPCANDFQRCTLSAAAAKAVEVVVFYGAQGTYATARGLGDFDCQPATFGVTDPVPNVRKACWIYAGYVGEPAVAAAASANTATQSTVPARMTACAQDFEQCNHLRASGMWVGVYGANNTYKAIAGRGPFNCLPSTFSIPDPLPNVQKTCYVQAVSVGTFRVTSAGGLPAGTTAGYLMYSGNGTHLWDVSFQVPSGGTVPISSLSPFALITSLWNIPANYTITLGDQVYNKRTASYEFPAQIHITTPAAFTGTVLYSFTAPTGSSPTGNIDTPALTITGE